MNKNKKKLLFIKLHISVQNAKSEQLFTIIVWKLKVWLLNIRATKCFWVCMSEFQIFVELSYFYYFSWNTISLDVEWTCIKIRKTINIENFTIPSHYFVTRIVIY